MFRIKWRKAGLLPWFTGLQKYASEAEALKQIDYLRQFFKSNEFAIESAKGKPEFVGLLLVGNAKDCNEHIYFSEDDE